MAFSFTQIQLHVLQNFRCTTYAVETTELKIIHHGIAIREGVLGPAYLSSHLVTYHALVSPSIK